MITLDIKSKDFKEAYERGRAAKYHVGFGWNNGLRVFVIYGKSGGSTEAIP